MKAHMPRLILILSALFFAFAGCDDDTSSNDGGTGTDGDGYVAGDEGGDPGSDPGASDGTGDESPNDAADQPADEGGDETVEPISASLPQAVADALLANPLTYAQIPLKVATTGEPDTVTVNFNDADYPGNDPDGDGVFVAQLPIESLAADSYTVTATAEKAGADPATATAELVISTTGSQLTDFYQVGPAGTPRVHRRGEDIWLTWTDTPDAIRTVWLQRIDGAGRWLGERVALLTDDEDTVYARTAFGADSIGILYQQPDGPYEIWFKIVDFEGNELLAPINLVPQDLYGSFGGDILYDGDSFIMVWRVNYGDGGGGEVHWMRVEEVGHAVTGPVVVATSGDNDPVGGFGPFSFVKVAAIGDNTLVTFVREQHNYFLDEDLPKSHAARVTKDGTLDWVEELDQPSDMFEAWRFHQEARVFAIDGQYILAWSRRDLNDEDPNAPLEIYACTADADGTLDPDRGMGTLMMDAPMTREEWQIVPHPSHFASMAWLDNRSAVEPGSGKIELMVAPLKDDLTVVQEVIFSHAVFVFGVTQLNAMPQDTNVLLIWLDERHGYGILDPKPEVWFETAWY